MTFTEHAATFPCAGDQLLGIVAAPEQPQATGVLIVVGGPQYRVGSHRQFLFLSRALAEAGYPAMRFDFRGTGDSTGELRDFEEVNEDIGAAIDAFQAHCPQLERIVLWGLCDAASAILLYWDMTQDARVGGLVLLNPWVRSEATLARTHIKHYYGQRLLQADFWHKLLSGKLGIGRALQGFVTSWLHARKTSGDAAADATLPFQKRMMRALEKYPGPALLILSSDDYTAKEFLEACQADAQAIRALAGARLTRVDVPGADHTFSSRDQRQAVEAATVAWLQQSTTP
jgi:uncharacterized protein